MDKSKLKLKGNRQERESEGAVEVCCETAEPNRSEMVSWKEGECQGHCVWDKVMCGVFESFTGRYANCCTKFN